MIVVTIQYKNENEFLAALNNLKHLGNIVRIHQAKQGEVWKKIRVDIDTMLENKGF